MPITISLLTTPTALEPINAPLWFRTNSTSSGLTDFKYIFRPEYKIEPFASTSFTTLGTYRIPPRPGAGDGLFSPHRTLKSFLTPKIDPYVSLFGSEASSLIDYRIKYGFEYNPDQIFTDTINVSGFMGITFSAIHDYIVGDILTLNKNNKNFNPQYDGTCSVVSVPNIYSVRTNKAFSSTLLANESGVVTSNFRISGTTSELFTWNGTRQYTEREKSFIPYLMGSQSGVQGKFLTNYNSTYKPVRLDDYETLSMILPSSPLQPYYLSVNTYRSNGSFIATYGLTYSTNTFRKLDVGVGPMNLINAGIPFISATGTNAVDSYDVQIKNSQFGFPTTASEFRKFKIDTTCSNYENQRIVFLNRLGGWDYFNFTLDSKKSITISRTEYEKILDWNYTIGDRGKTILAQKAETKMSINSNWITEKDSIWLEELLTSPEVYLMPYTNIVYKDDAFTYLTNGGTYTKAITLPAIGVYNVQFDIIKLQDDLVIYDGNGTLDTIAAGVPFHYSKKLNITTTTFYIENYLNYPADITIANIVITKTTGDKLPIIITDNAYEVKTYLRNQVFNLSLNYKFGFDLNLQNE
jgi:hypothetical protein